MVAARVSAEVAVGASGVSLAVFVCVVTVVTRPEDSAYSPASHSGRYVLAAFEARVGGGGNHEACDKPYVSALFRDTFVMVGDGHSNDSRVAWPQRCADDDDLYACDEPSRYPGGESARSIGRSVRGGRLRGPAVSDRWGGTR